MFAYCLAVSLVDVIFNKLVIWMNEAGYFVRNISHVIYKRRNENVEAVEIHTGLPTSTQQTEAE